MDVRYYSYFDDKKIERVMQMIFHGKSAIWGSAAGAVVYGLQKLDENGTVHNVEQQIANTDKRISDYKKERQEKGDQFSFVEGEITSLSDRPNGVHKIGVSTYSTLIAEQVVVQNNNKQQLKYELNDYNTRSVGEVAAIGAAALVVYGVRYLVASDWSNNKQTRTNAQKILKKTDFVAKGVSQTLTQFKEFFTGPSQKPTPNQPKI